MDGVLSIVVSCQPNFPDGGFAKAEEDSPLFTFHVSKAISQTDVSQKECTSPSDSD
jgi:hypothetical protein